jgi:hypothetical protein
MTRTAPAIAPGGMIGEEVDLLTVDLKVSPRELKLMLDALIESDRYMCQEGKLQTADLRRWDAILDYVKSSALEFSA